MKLKQSSLDFHAFISIYGDQIGNSFIKKIYQTSSNEFVFQIYRSDMKKRNLMVSLSKGIFFYDPRTPDEASTVSMILRKSLSERRIVKIEQINFDRVVRIELNTGQEIILELFREGNLIVTNNGLMDFVFNPREWKNRRLIKGEKYVPPGLIDPLSYSPEDMKKVLVDSKGSIVQTLATRMNLGGDVAEEVAYRIGVEKDTPSRMLEVQSATILESIIGVVRESEKNRAFYYSDEEVVSPILLTHIQKKPDREFDDLSEGYRYYLDNYPDEVRKESPLERRIESQMKSIEEFTALMNRYQEMGKLVMSNFGEISKILKEFNESARKTGLGSIKDVSGHPVTDIDPVKKTVKLMIGEVEVILNYTVSPGENANILFGEAKNYRAKIKGAETAIEQTKREMVESSKKTAVSRKRSKFWFEVYHWFRSSEGYLVIAGRDAKSNEKIVKKHLSDRDIYVHADIHGAPSTIIKVEGDIKPGEATLKEAGTFAVSFSRAWSAGIRSGTAYWVLPSQVSKTPESGEYVSKGSWIIRGKRNYIFDLPIELAVCQTNENGITIPLIGPVSSLQNVDGKKVIIIPGSQKRSQVARTIAEQLDLPVDEIEGVLPPGNSQILQ
jgi:predicted ribosome quality control (RQC) complex YloA/Tae2 family protein